jgi:hypothetical protein
MAGLVGNGNLVARTKFSQLLAGIIPLPATGHIHSRYELFEKRQNGESQPLYGNRTAT